VTSVICVELQDRTDQQYSSILISLSRHKRGLRYHTHPPTPPKKKSPIRFKYNKFPWWDLSYEINLYHTKYIIQSRRGHLKTSCRGGVQKKKKRRKEKNHSIRPVLSLMLYPSSVLPPPLSRLQPFVFHSSIHIRIPSCLCFFLHFIHSFPFLP